ncbi:MAG: hypothetical protein ACRBFS_17825 [Aureispira sp.]
MPSTCYLFLLFPFLWACSPPPSKTLTTVAASSLLTDTLLTASPQDTLVPIWGYRFSIQGDFNGDGKQDTLVEHFKEEISQQETHKYYEGIEHDLDYQYYNSELRNVYTTLESTDGSVFPFLQGSYLGFSWLETIGDIDNNGTDEIGYVFNNADMSNINTFYIYTLRDSHWIPMHHFTIRESNFPPIPYYFTTYGLFGAFGHQEVKDSLLNQQLIQGIDTFQWVKLIAPYIIDYQTTGDVCEIYYKLALPHEKPLLNSLIWVEAINLTLPPFMAKRWLQYDLSGYQEATQQKILEELKTSKHEICDPTSEFPMRVFLKKD